MSINTQVLIVGGSINGATLAIILAQNGLDVTLVEPKKITGKALSDFDGRAYSLALATCKMLKILNLWEEIKLNSEPILDIKVNTSNRSTSSSDSLLHFSHIEMAEGDNP